MTHTRQNFEQTSDKIWPKIAEKKNKQDSTVFGHTVRPNGITKREKFKLTLHSIADTDTDENVLGFHFS